MLKFYIEIGYVHPASGDWIREHKTIEADVPELEEELTKPTPYAPGEVRVLSVELGKETREDA